jgi:RND family efflux transporter MFP subunit
MADIKDDLAALRIDRELDSPPRRGWLWVSAAIVIVAAAFGGWRWFSRDRPVAVETAIVTQRGAGMQAAVLNASGYVTARRRATVSSKITGKVIEVNVEEGMSVREGQVLARLDAASFVAALALADAQAEAARRAVRENEVRLEDARRTLRRRTQLVQDKLVTEADLDTARADVDSLEARIAATRAQVAVAERQIELERTNLDNAVIRAPFSGVAISKDAQPGEMVSPVSAGGGFTRTGICTIVDMRSLEIEVDVNESYINRVKTAQPVTAVLDAYPDWQIPAHVITTVPSADRQKATVLVRIGFDASAGRPGQGRPERGRTPIGSGTNGSGSTRPTATDERLDPRLLPDMGVKVTFLRDDDTERESLKAVTLAPKGAIANEDGETFVFVVNNGVAERRAVKTAGTDGDRIEVIEGVAPGERVVLSPPPTLKPGDKVAGK